MLDDVPEGTLVYCCGPSPLLDAVEERCPPGILRVERFSPKDRPGGEGAEFEVGVDPGDARQQVRQQVPADRLHGVAAGVHRDVHAGHHLAVPVPRRGGDRPQTLPQLLVGQGVPLAGHTQAPTASVHKMPRRT
ncbi:hypothetical protein GCM10010398_70480 [Streptomyces fimbriatus]